MKHFILLALLSASVLLCGCGTVTPLLTPQRVTTLVSDGVKIGTQKFPQAIPAIRIAQPVICGLANSTNLQPAEIVAALEAAGVSGATNQEASLIIDGGLFLYDEVFASYGAGWEAQIPQLQLYLQSVCDGLMSGLPPTAEEARRKAMLALPPHL